MKNSPQEIFSIFTPQTRGEIPEEPGVYIYKDKSGTIIYVGKAKNLRKRVSSYFIKRQVFLKTYLLVQEIANIDIIVVTNEREALLLEATLIKKHLPRYNINFKDGKFYPYIKATKDKFPRIVITRNKIDDGSRYFGPYISAGAVRSNLEILQKLFKLRTCKVLPKKECLEYHMGRCSAPCINKIDDTAYAASVSDALAFLEGGRETLINALTAKMKEAAKSLLFEKAQIYKAQIDALNSLEEHQHVFLQDENATDIIGISNKNGAFGIAVSLLRKGRLSGKLGFTVKSKEEASAVLEEFLISRYIEDSEPPTALIVNTQYQELAENVSALFEENQIPIVVRSPKEDEQPLMLITERNASLHLERLLTTPDSLEILKEMQKVLGLKHFPSRIEGYDIAKLDGSLASGVMVCFTGGEADKKAYRMFNIRHENQQDDYAGMEEMLSRRLKRAPAPGLIVIDGGKGQLSAACKALEQENLPLDNIIALAKQNEEIFIPNRDESIILARNSAVLQLLQRVRDESHRFSQYQLHRRMDKKMKQ
ncbi:MAG: excinuclease ABC subunit UvrC [Brevinema sp.]